MTCSIRRVLNLTYTWLFDLIGGTETWDKEYKHVFDDEQHEDFDFVDLPPTAAPVPVPGSSTTAEPSVKPSIQWGGY